MRRIRREFCDFIVMILGVLCLCALLAGCRGEEAQEDGAFTEIAAGEPQAADPEDDGEAAGAEETGEEAAPEKAASDVIYVFVCGQVAEPGAYELHEGDRVTHAIRAAGGMTDDAAQDCLNQAALLEDGQKIYVPSREEAELLDVQGDDESGTAGETGRASEGDGKVNLNTADKAELMTLSGIGESRADAILAYRQEHGRFERIEDIKKIEGIKEGIFNRIKDRLTV